ncbi:MAG: class I SAM-dependent methyltransferase, partial [Myxococcota bacterium]|nr:class I SAM-dependent methyltransferase [Myxococcota bacterium]
MRLRLNPENVRAVARGHPWVYRDGVRGRARVGTPVTLVDQRGRTVAFGLADDGEIAVRVLAREPQPIEALIQTRIRQAFRARSQLLPADTNAFRGVNGEGDGLSGLVVDRYDSLLVLRLYGACWQVHLPVILAALRRLDGVETIARRLGVRRVDGTQGLEVLEGPEPAETMVVQEAGLSFLVRPDRGQKTGLFLDQREHRIRVGQLARGRDVVDLFSYTGGFGVHAAAAGARQVHLVDIAADALDDARENFRLNGLNPDKHRFDDCDAFEWEAPGPVGVFVCDPPALSHKRGADSAARRRYRDLA